MTKRKQRRHKYLEKLGIYAFPFRVEPCGRADGWKKQQQTYGFDERETWGLAGTMDMLAYERLCMYRDVNCINMDYHQIQYNGKIKSYGAWLDILIEKFAACLSEAHFRVEEKEFANDRWLLFDALKGYLWW